MVLQYSVPFKVTWVAPFALFAPCAGTTAGLAGGLLAFTTLAYHGHCWQPVFGLLAGFAPKKLDTSLNEVPMDANHKNNSVSVHLRVHQGKRTYWGYNYFTPSIAKVPTWIAVPAGGVKLVFEPAGRRNYPNCWHIRCPELRGAGALDCAHGKYDVNTPVNFFHSMRFGNQKFVINYNKTISPIHSPFVVLGADIGGGNLKLVNRDDSNRRLHFHVKVDPHRHSDGNEGRVSHDASIARTVAPIPAVSASGHSAVQPAISAAIPAISAGSTSARSDSTPTAAAVFDENAHTVLKQPINLSAQLAELKQALDLDLISAKEYEVARGKLLARFSERQ